MNKYYLLTELLLPKFNERNNLDGEKLLRTVTFEKHLPMDEKLLQLELIEKFANCSSGDEAVKILEENLELLDINFFQMMEAVAEKASQKGDKNRASWLRNMAKLLSKMLNLSQTSSKGNELEFLDEEKIKAYLEFLIKVLQATAESKSDSEVVYPLLAVNTDKLNANLAELMRHLIPILFQEARASEAEFIAATIIEFSNLINNFYLGNQASNMEIAITGYEVISIIFTQEISPEIWAMTQHNLGETYRKRLVGNKSENLEKAITYLEAASTVYTQSTLPLEWAMTQHLKGIAYCERIVGNKSENLEKAITYLEAALTVFTQNASPFDWAKTQNNLGAAYMNKNKGDNAKNLEKAIACLEAALTVFTQKASPLEWAMTQHNLGVALSERIKGNKAENLDKAIGTFETALTVFTQDTLPLWTGMENRLVLKSASKYLQGFKTIPYRFSFNEKLRFDTVMNCLKKKNKFPQFYA